MITLSSLKAVATGARYFGRRRTHGRAHCMRQRSTYRYYYLLHDIVYLVSLTVRMYPNRITIQTDVHHS